MSNRPYLGKWVSDEVGMYRPFVYGSEGAVSSNSPYATAAGLEILRKGGNAADAAVAISLALGVVEPYHCGIGGGCFFLFYDSKNGEFSAMDARGVAPSQAYQDMFLDENGQVDLNLTEYSGRSVASPSLYRAMDTLLKEHGTMTLEEVSAPAIRLAREGFGCGFQFARLTDIDEAEHNSKCYEGFAELYLKDGGPHEFGDVIRNPDLADTMEQVARHGVDWFYTGPIADEIVKNANKHHGILTRQDLEQCPVKPCKPVKGTYRGYEVVSMPPPSSGGPHIIQMLNVLENFDLASMGHNSADSTHVIAETMKMMFADRSVAMGDPDFVDIPLEKLMSKKYAKELAGKIDLYKAGDYSPGEGIEARPHRGCTSHFSVMDKQGNVLVQTQTVRNWWGCGVVVPGRGFLLNNAMADFSAKLGVRTTQGLAYGEANGIRAGKTPLSSMTPTIVMKDGRPYLAIGAAGGPRIITSTLLMILNVIDYGMMMEPAVRAPHICCLSKQQGLELEAGFSRDTMEKLKERGHRLVPLEEFAEILVMPNGIMQREGLFYPAGTNRTDGGGGAITASGMTAIDGLCYYP